MNLMFWKKNRDATEDSEDDAQHISDDVIESGEPPEPEGDASRDKISEDADAEAGDDSAPRSKGLLIAGTVAGMMMLLAGGFFAMKFFLSSHQKNHAPADTQAAAQPAPLPVNHLIKLPPIGVHQSATVQPDSQPANINDPAKKDSGLQAQVVPQQNQQRPDVSPDTHATGNSHALSSNPNGDLVVGSKDPESAAIALKQMIKIMNADSSASPENAAR